MTPAALIRVYGFVLTVVSMVSGVFAAEQYYDPGAVSVNWQDAAWGPAGGAYDQVWTDGSDAVIDPTGGVAEIVGQGNALA